MWVCYLDIIVHGFFCLLLGLQIEDLEFSVLETWLELIVGWYDYRFCVLETVRGPEPPKAPKPEKTIVYERRRRGGPGPSSSSSKGKRK